MEIQRNCPSCGEETTFHLMASEKIHLGKKTKWYCGECDYEIIRINGDVDTSIATA